MSKRFDEFVELAKKEFGITIVKTEKGKGLKMEDVYPELVPFVKNKKQRNVKKGECIEMDRLTHKDKEPKHPCYVDMFWEEYETKNKHEAIKKLGKLEDLMEKYKVKDLEELELMISTYIDNRGDF